MKNAAHAGGSKKRKWKLFSAENGFDSVLFSLLMIILAVGLVCLLSASHAYSFYKNDGDSYHYIERQLLFAAMGVAAMLAVSLSIITCCTALRCR